MKIKRSVVLFCAALTLNHIALAEETPAETRDVFAHAFNALKKSEAVYDANIPATELAKRERENVAANREALAALRVLLKNSPQGWETQDFDTTEGTERAFEISRNMREFGRLLVRESNVRLADGDVVGAMSSRLDCFQLAVILGRNGRLIDSLVSNAIEAVAWKDIEKVASQLDAKSCVEFANRIEAIRAGKMPYVAVVRKEKAGALAGIGKMFPENWKQEAEQNKDKMSAVEWEKLQTVSPEKMAVNVAAAFDLVIANASLPYPLLYPKVKMGDEYSEMMMSGIAGPEARFRFDLSENRTRLVQAALLIRARESGALSKAEFDKLLPRDIFSSAPLKEKALTPYSVGPDGEDDGGQPFKNVLHRFDPQTGQYGQFNPKVPQVDSVGDIIGPDFMTAKE